MAKVLAIVFFAAGAFIALGIFIPRFRPRWKGSRIVCGAITCAGFGLSMMSLAADKFFAGSLSGRQHDWLVRLFFIGLAVDFVGFFLDRRRARQGNAMDNLQTHLIKTKGGFH